MNLDDQEDLELTNKVKLHLMKHFEDIQFKIDISCQSIINVLKCKGEMDQKKLKAIEQRYIKQYIGSLKTIEQESMNKLNKFMLNNNAINTNQSMDEILFKAGCDFVISFENSELEFDLRCLKEFIIGAFVHCPFWLDQNQANFIRVKFMYNGYTDSEDFNGNYLYKDGLEVTLDKV